MGKAHPQAPADAAHPQAPAGAVHPQAPTHSHYLRDPDALMRRLRRVEGQVRGIQKMVADDRYCVDILVQLAAARAALDEVGLALLEGHTKGCVADAVRSGDAEEKIDELMGAVRRFVR